MSLSPSPIYNLLCCSYCWDTQSRPTLCNTMDCSPSGSSVHGISQARILEWVGISFSRGISQPMDRTAFPAGKADSLSLNHLGNPYKYCTYSISCLSKATYLVSQTRQLREPIFKYSLEPKTLKSSNVVFTANWPNWRIKSNISCDEIAISV